MMFQFTLSRGERHAHTEKGTGKRKFQFTLPRGERRPYVDKAIKDALVSIHAPARGATQLRCQPIARSSFQFTLPRGERQPRLFASLSLSSMFQFTLPRGERHCWEKDKEGNYMFQFTLPRGERQLKGR